MSPAARSTAARYRPAWRVPIGETRPVKNVGDVEMTARGFERLTAEGFQPVENDGDGPSPACRSRRARRDQGAVDQATLPQAAPLQGPFFAAEEPKSGFQLLNVRLSMWALKVAFIRAASRSG